MRRSKRGFSLVEIMVALAIMGVVAVQVTAMFSGQMETYVAQSRVVDIQGDARLAADMIRRDIRMAGFMVPRMVGLANRDGGNAGSDALCTSDWSRFSDTELDQALDRFDATSLTADLAENVTRVEVVAVELDIDGDGNDDYAVGEGIIVSAGTGTHCARITAIAGGEIDFEPETPTGFAAPMVSARAVPAIIIEVGSDGLRRNGLLLSPLVEDMQVAFAVDLDADGEIEDAEFPIHTLTALDPALVRGAELTVLTRTLVEDPALETPGRQAIGNRDAAGAPDSFRRRHSTITIAPRNML
jgi:prepilin-type N-terminal cleavage/methylation domain-containing protein